MRLFSYIVANDAGFAPNPFGGYCTLATCKPKIRKYAKEGDWIIGLSPKEEGNKLVYAMQVKIIITSNAYFNDNRFAIKKPNMHSEKPEERCGDNIYFKNDRGEYIQTTNAYHLTPKDTIKDTKDPYVLISGFQDFYYFGKDTISLEDLESKLVVGNGHRCRFDENTIRNFIEFIEKLKKGINAKPKNLGKYRKKVKL
jgi:hypothetical protein